MFLCLGPEDKNFTYQNLALIKSFHFPSKLTCKLLFGEAMLQESIHGYTGNLYGEDVWMENHQLECLRLKRTGHLCSLTFLVHHRDTGTIPHFPRCSGN